MYHKSCSDITHQTYFSKTLSQTHGHHIYLTICRNMPTDSELWTKVNFSDLPAAEHTPCKLCLATLNNHIGYSIREYCRLFGHNVNLSFCISEDILPNVIVRIKGEK